MKLKALYKRLEKLALAIAVGWLTVLAPAPSNAAEREALFAPGMVREVIDPDVCVSKVAGLEFLRCAKEEEPPPQETTNFHQVSISSGQPQANQEAPAQSAPLNFEQILASYGNPESDIPVNAIETAPAPFKGMMAALQSGENELAFDYARQYARYLRDYKERTSYAHGLIGKAMKAEHMREGSLWMENEQFDEQEAIYRKYLERRRKERTESGESDIETDSLDAEAQDLLDFMREQELAASQRRADLKEGYDPKVIFPDEEPVVDQDLARQEFQRVLATQEVPVDPQGKVDVYFFFRSRDLGSQPKLVEFEKLFQAHKDNPNLRFVALTMDPGLKGELDTLRYRYHLNFPIRSGAERARKLKVEDSPSTVFIATSTGQILRKGGGQSFVYLDEILKRMTGK